MMDYERIKERIDEMRRRSERSRLVAEARRASRAAAKRGTALPAEPGAGIVHLRPLGGPAKEAR